MTGKPIYLEPHGSRLHLHAILEAKLICRERGYADLDPAPLQHKGLYPAVPDVYIKMPIRTTDEHGRASHGEMRYIIEIETDASKHSIEMKRAQYDTSLTGHDLLIINLAEMKKRDSLDELNRYIGMMIP